MLEIHNKQKRLIFLKLMGSLHSVRTHIDLTTKKEYFHIKFYFDEIYSMYAWTAPGIFDLDPAEWPSDYW